MMRDFDILVAGEINPDLILSGDVEPVFGQVEKRVDTADLVIGSSSVIFACGAARLGLRVAFIGVCGDDVFGRFMLDEMQRRDINIEHVIIEPAGSTGLSVILTRGADRAILTYPGLIAALRAEDVADRLISQARHLHVASFFLQDKLQPGLAELFRRAHALGLSTSLDTNYDPSGMWSGFDELLPLVDVFLPNDREAVSLTRTENIDEALDQLSRLNKTIAIKLGAQGALGRAAGEQARVPSIPVNVVDTVGAGDSFDAGFLYGFLNDWPLERSLRLACVCGALSVQQPGGTQGQPTLEEAMQYVDG
jgi:sugar/nucleoside kinase (ribokinase family)